jgi:signal transduction histidine kinase
MRRPFLIFLGAVLLPGLLLGGLAWRSVQAQEAVQLQDRLRLIHAAAERLAQALSTRLDEHQREFSLRVESLLGKQSPRTLASAFDDQIRQHWSLAQLGFAVSLAGDLLAPLIQSRPEARHFVFSNNDFLCNRSSLQLFAVTPKGKIDLSDPGFQSPIPTTPPPSSANPTPPAAAVPDSDRVRRLAQWIGDAQEGVLSRFVDDQLAVWVWYRTPREPELVFGAQLSLASLRGDLTQRVESTPIPVPGISLALLDDRGRLVARTPSPEPPHPIDLSRSLATASPGPGLPGWHVAAFISDPAAFRTDSLRLRRTLALVIVLLVAAIAIGGFLVVTGARRQLELARRRTDFVSGVSHELRTPLTSIHLFAEMLAEDRITDPEKRRHHLRIIRAEAGRLHRLIGGILDFARHERGETPLHPQRLDLADLVAGVAATFSPHLARLDVTLHQDFPAQPVEVLGDPDALAQLVNNLISNASKYAAGGGEITLRLRQHAARATLEVLDRGPGVPESCRERVFEEFFRTEDARAGGEPGVGLGLTLARRIARAHQGELTCHPRPGGGACFRLELPTPP